MLPASSALILRSRAAASRRMLQKARELQTLEIQNGSCSAPRQFGQKVPVAFDHGLLLSARPTLDPSLHRNGVRDALEVFREHQGHRPSPKRVTMRVETGIVLPDSRLDIDPSRPGVETTVTTAENVEPAAIMLAHAVTSPCSLLSPHPEEPRSGVSKYAPESSGSSWNILRDALLRSAPQDEGRG